MDGETIYGIIHVFFLIAGGYFLTEAEKIFEEKHYYSTWWMILIWLLYFPIPYIAVLLWLIARNIGEIIKFEKPD